MNNRHDYAVRKLEMITQVKQQALSKFADAALGNWGSGMASTSFYKSLNLLYAYFDVNDKLVKNITEVHHNHINEYQRAIANFIKDLSKQIKNK